LVKDSAQHIYSQKSRIKTEWELRERKERSVGLPARNNEFGFLYLKETMM